MSIFLRRKGEAILPKTVLLCLKCSTFHRSSGMLFGWTNKVYVSKFIFLTGNSLYICLSAPIRSQILWEQRLSLYLCPFSYSLTQIQAVKEGSINICEMNTKWMNNIVPGYFEILHIKDKPWRPSVLPFSLGPGAAFLSSHPWILRDIVGQERANGQDQIPINLRWTRSHCYWGGLLIRPPHWDKSISISAKHGRRKRNQAQSSL